MQKPVSILLALWVLLLSTHIPLHAHFCKDTLVDATLYVEAKKCCSKQSPVEHQVVFKNICCSDLELVFDGYEDCVHPFVADFATLDFVLTDIEFPYQVPVASVENTLFAGKDPPCTSKVPLYTMFEVYLI